MTGAEAGDNLISRHANIAEYLYNLNDGTIYAYADFVMYWIQNN